MALEAAGDLHSCESIHVSCIPWTVYVIGWRWMKHFQILILVLLDVAYDKYLVSAADCLLSIYQWGLQRRK